MASSRGPRSGGTNRQNVDRPTPLVLAIVLAAGWLLIGLGRPAPSLALSCDYPYWCATFLIQLDGNGSGTVASSDANGVPDGRITCTEVNGVTTPTSICKNVWRAFVGSTIVIYFSWTAAAGSCGEQDLPTVDCGTATHGIEKWIVGGASNGDLYSFNRFPEQVTVATTGAGSGRVTSSPSGIDCPSACTTTVLWGTALTLTAVADPGWAFLGWTGDCMGQGAACTLHPTSDIDTHAFFGTPAATPRPTSTAAPPRTPGPSAGAPQATAVNPRGTPAASTGSHPTGDPSSTQGPNETTAFATPSNGAGSQPTPDAVQQATPTTTNATPQDLTPIAFAIVGAGALVAIAVFGSNVLGRRRP